MKNILFIARNYEPYDNSSGTKALVKIASNLAANVDVFCLYLYADKIEKYTYKKVRVFPNRKSYPSEHDEKKGWDDAKKMCLEGINLAYVRGSLAELDVLVSRTQYDLIISVCYPFEAHYIASIVSKRHHIDWVAWYLDPYYSNSMYSTLGIKGRYEREKQVLVGAKQIITLPLLAVEYADFGRQVSIELPFIDDFAKEEKEHKFTIDKTHISFLFAGNIYKNLREPDYLFNLMKRKEMKNVVLYFVNTMQNYSKDEIKQMINGASENIIFINRQTDRVVNDLMDQADYLINIGNTMDNQLPGKVYSYISSGKPIINICKKMECPSLNILKDYPMVLNLYEGEDVEVSLSKVENFLNTEKKDKISWDSIKNRYSEIIADEIIKKFTMVIEGL